MGEKFNMFLNDLVELGRVVDVTDLAIPMGFLVWAVILLLPLHRIDRRCRTTATVYVLFCVTAGIVLIIVIPQAYISSIPIQTQAILIGLMGGLAAFRWNVRFSDLSKKHESQDKDFDNQEGVDSGGQLGVAHTIPQNRAN